ncbi:MAG: hemolysin III family protein [Oscillospiraceae bacterium]|nr:hemolysin III family protein [Oscillospiraceae bacterium]MBQ4544673.1 hemolysin III family protein [Oscillospiraceae bacterium]MBQ6901393.1 hemolysin III family protein [Oscillospiraceae bacterium]
MDKTERRKLLGLPSYTLGEELTNSISHGLGAAFGIVALVLCVVFGARQGDAWKVVSGAIYGASMIVLYSISTIYHALGINRAKKVFRTLDHCSIYFLIAGTYTPYTLVAMRESSGFLVFAVVWTAAVLGIVLNAINVHRFRVVSMILYIAMGWAIVFSARDLIAAVPPVGVTLLISGGVLYTIGAVLYGIGKTKKYMHSVFHFLALGGSVCHFISVFAYVLL